MSFIRKFKRSKPGPVPASGPISDVGLTLIWEPDNGNTEVDVVFVHGFTGHPQKTWTFQGSKTTTYWPRDKVPQTLPSARVWTFGYDTKIGSPFRPENQNTIYGEGKELVASLADVRPANEENVPLIFVAHSLGGIVVKQALRYSEKCREQLANRNLGLIYDSVIGILFFGTPHGGADPRGISHHIVQSLAKIAGVRVNPNTMATLLPSSAELEQLRDEFLPLVRKNRWTITSFQEQRGTPLLHGKLVVEKACSSLGDVDIERTRAMNKNHGDMCKFSEEDPEYSKVDRAFKHAWESWTMELRMSLKAKWRGSISEDQRKQLLSTLWWSEMNARENSIDHTSVETVQWIFDSPKGASPRTNQTTSSNGQAALTGTAGRFYLDCVKEQDTGSLLQLWLESNESMFWIRGKAGCGKSTVMKFLINDHRTPRYLQKWQSSVRILRFFFVEVNTSPLQRQVQGCCRSLLYQVLNSECALLDNVLQNHPYLATKQSENDWSAKELQETLTYILEKSETAFCLFIDGLDEVPNEHHGLAVELMTALANIQNVKVCVSSREENSLSGLTPCSSLHLQDLNRHGIKAYIEQRLAPRLKTFGDTEDKIFSWKVHRLKYTLVEKSCGIFLWVAFAVRSLLRGIDNGDSLQILYQRTSEFAPSLDDLYQQMWSRQNMDQHLYRQESAQIFWMMLDSHHEPNQWMTTFVGNLFLTNISLSKEILGILRIGRLATIQQVQLLFKKHSRWLSARSAGLVEHQSHISAFVEHRASIPLSLPLSKQSEVGFIHRSVREYLLNTPSGRVLLGYDTRDPEDKWLRSLEALEGTAIFSIVYKTNIFADYVRMIPLLLPENMETQACASFAGLVACHVVIGHVSVDDELRLLNDFSDMLGAVSQTKSLQLAMFICAAAYGASQFLSQSRGRILATLTTDEQNAILFSACDIFETHEEITSMIPDNWMKSMDMQEYNILTFKMIRRSIGSVKYMLLANADAQAVFPVLVKNSLEKTTTPFLACLRRLFKVIASLTFIDRYSDEFDEDEAYSNELKLLYLDIGACIRVFNTLLPSTGYVILDKNDYGAFCLDTQPLPFDSRVAFAVSTRWFVEFFQMRELFWKDPSRWHENSVVHDRVPYVKCIVLESEVKRRRCERPPKNIEDETLRDEKLKLEAAFEELLWDRGSWRHERGRIFAAQSRDLDRKFGDIVCKVLDSLYEAGSERLSTE
ncbi:uncharacterized protein FFB20_13588 [Fusarium fujikuroi]|uniref:NACHT domain-containing protein n=2 Tax=Fusarium fujikuroi TaxID=5127 RepID=S0EQ37_GIBF5|nr:uncharacterized protein FFUJ_14146 [Fusarium fujikuroi IMI 58289]QGI71403.1 hypothetical protein CEK27_003732 [Fusarium fujikuroi]QGI88733.1 hypothetical protein CEK25_003689 [Fusarium fujikuroi]QGJ02298.1 hypothetical protein CEK26_003742 [Fusarium fujikuroi]CCT76220.1 uncharacterized protein FFUJ_14146 [Fusarium fujikuroi IMI 58289]SCO10621.1 uncharacterized protein FFB20_13588 [Fusarium fujikuroi]